MRSSCLVLAFAFLLNDVKSLTSPFCYEPYGLGSAKELPTPQLQGFLTVGQRGEGVISKTNAQNRMLLHCTLP